MQKKKNGAQRWGDSSLKRRRISGFFFQHTEKREKREKKVNLR